MTTAMAMAVAASSSVLGSWSAISSATGRLLKIERPKSPTTARREEARVLDGERIVEAELGAQLRHLLRRGVGAAQHDEHGVAGQQVDDREDDQRHPEHDGDGEGQPLLQVDEHQRRGERPPQRAADAG